MLNEDQSNWALGVLHRAGCNVNKAFQSKWSRLNKAYGGMSFVIASDNGANYA